MQWDIWIDRGGTFTDLIATNQKGEIKTYKILSHNPEHYDDSCSQGIINILQLKDHTQITSAVQSIKLGTTVGTNALLEHSGEPLVFVTTRGFKDALRIAYQNRPDLFALNIILPTMLYQDVIEIDQRVDAGGVVINKLNLEQARGELQACYQQGIRSLAIVFMHAYRYPEDELRVKKLAQEIGFEYVSISSDVSSLIKFVARGDTTLVDAYLSKKLYEQVSYTQHHFGAIKNSYMQSNGGVCAAHHFRAKDSILSGPAGGVVGAVHCATGAGFAKVITFDMGGTSTDIAHYAGEFERTNDSEVAGFRITSPMLSIHTIAAGGGSIIKYQQQRFQVGPESAGADPGPICYGKHGPLTITDCNVQLGKINPDYFPKVFGESGTQCLDSLAVNEAFAALACQINDESNTDLTPEQVAGGFVDVAITNMANAIKRISIQKGHDVTDYVLVAFGGAGAQHACLVAQRLGICQILLNPLAGVLSAYGIGIADIRIIEQKTVEKVLADDHRLLLTALFDRLHQKTLASLQQQQETAENITLIKKIHLKYKDTNVSLALSYPASMENLKVEFGCKHHETYGYTLSDQSLVIEKISVELIKKNDLMTIYHGINPPMIKAKPIATTRFYSNNSWLNSDVYQRDQLVIGQIIAGPAIIVEANSTIVLEPGWHAELTQQLDLLLTSHASMKKTQVSIERADPIMLEIFNNLFMSIAEQMGEALVNTAMSVNIKERKDFSCALFDNNGDLIANAPHIPVHLGSMSESVKEIIRQNHGDMRAGDAYMLNDPYRGGTHLPDITIVSPLFVQGQSQPIFYVASRGHHADIGGITPGSMPAHSDHINQEGLLFDNIKIINQGELNETLIMSLLTAGDYPARNPQQNFSDLRAQIAANQQGINQLHQMIAEFGLNVVLAYTRFVQHNAEYCVRQAIALLNNGQAVTTMDNGIKIVCAIKVNHEQKKVTLDFTGSSQQSNHNFHAPRSVTMAAILYVFRCLVKQNIPLNAGCLRPLNIIIPDDCVLSPSYPAAVVAGNVETSQCIVDTLFTALGVLANSQGTMNNVLFGNQNYQYYETVCGGAGAGHGFKGASAIQTHMTNSLLTDPEILELRYPVILEKFAIRSHSGGYGKWQGGDGVVRRIRFLQPMNVNILSNRRVTCAQGLHGGQPGQSGTNYVIKSNGTKVMLSSSSSIDIECGDSLVVETPGGGGFGSDGTSGC